jgi:hypothetical protein
MIPLSSDWFSFPHTSQLHAMITFALIAKLTFTWFNSKFKLSLAFIFVAVAIGPVVALPTKSVFMIDNKSFLIVLHRGPQR